MVDVLLVVPPRTPFQRRDASEPAEDCAPPLGLMALAASLEEEEYSCRILDMYRMGESIESIPRSLVEYSPKVVGVTCVSSQARVANEVALACHECDPDLILVCGGIHATVRASEMIDPGAFDYVLRGECDFTFVELVRDLLERGQPNGHIKGLCFHDGSQVVVAKDLGCVENLDSLPVPARDCLDLDQYVQRGALATSRGCNSACYFCSAATFRSCFRTRSAALVLQEMDEVCARSGIHEFEFVEDNLAGDMSRLRDIATGLKKRSYTWGCQVAIRDLRQDLHTIDLMAEGGCRSVFIGVESGDAELLRRIKGLSLEDVRSVTERSQACGMLVCAGFIIGHPWDTEESIANTVEMMRRLRREGIMCSVSLLTPFPGSPIGEHPESFGVSIHTKVTEEYTFSRSAISTMHLSQERLSAIYADTVISFAEEDAVLGAGSDRNRS